MTLANRRAHWVEPVEWRRARWLIQASLDEKGRAAEIFLDPADGLVSVDENLLGFVHAAAITASHLLRGGETAHAMAERLDCQHPDLLQLAFKFAARIEKDYGPYVRELESWKRGQAPLPLEAAK